MSDKPLRLLSIGNSFTLSVCRQLPPMAAHEGRDLRFANLFIGGCSLRRHAENLEKSAADPSFRPYRLNTYGFAPEEGLPAEGEASSNELLARGDWDVVTVQQASHESWDYANYQPFGHAVVSAVRAACPKAEVVIQQTWAYRADDDRIRPGGAWGFDQAGMADRVFAAYERFGADEGIARRIPTGRAVWISRRRELSPFQPYDPATLPSYRWPDLPPQAGDVVGQMSWRRNWETGEMEIGRDTIHLNPRGEYLQALTWFGFLFGADPTAVSYVSPHVGDRDARFLRLCARDALAQK